MTGHEKFQIYTAMYEQAKVLEKAIRRYYEERGYTIYCVYLAVADEEERTFFVDIEVGGSPEKYHRIYGEKTAEALKNKYMA